MKFKEVNVSGTRVRYVARIRYYSNHTANFQVELLLAGDVEPNPSDSEGNNSLRNSQPNGNNFNSRNIILGFLGLFGRPRTAINYVHFGLESGMVFEELRERMNVAIASIPNE